MLCVLPKVAPQPDLPRGGALIYHVIGICWFTLQEQKGGLDKIKIEGQTLLRVTLAHRHMKQDIFMTQLRVYSYRQQYTSLLHGYTTLLLPYVLQPYKNTAADQLCRCCCCCCWQVLLLTYKHCCPGPCPQLSPFETPSGRHATQTFSPCP